MKRVLISKLRENFLLKCLSLVLAVFLWYFISARGYSELTLQLPVELVNIPEGYEVTEKSTDRVNVSFLGSTKILRLLNPEQLRVSIDMKNTDEGSHRIMLTPNNIKVPSAVSITDIRPGTIAVTIEKMAEKVVPVRLNLKDSSIAERFLFTITPDTVRIKGPESTLKKVNYVITEPIDIDPSSAEGKLKVSLIPLADRVKIQTGEVEVTYIRNKSQ